jgi:hypothetical protein
MSLPMSQPPDNLVGMLHDGTLPEAAQRISEILAGVKGPVVEVQSGRPGLEAVDQVSLHPLTKGRPPNQVWAVDGGQALVADARSCAVVATRVARCCLEDGATAVEEVSPLQVAVLSSRDSAQIARTLGLAPTTAVDADLLRDVSEWDAVRRSVEEARPGATVLVDGDLEADWRLPEDLVAGIAARALEKSVMLLGVTKRSSLVSAGAPLVPLLEGQADGDPRLGPLARWWAPVLKSKADQALQRLVVVVRLDPMAPYAFRIDIANAGGAHASDAVEEILSSLSAVCDDAAFPGYPYPLAVADRLAAFPGWLRFETRMMLDEQLERLGVGLTVRERCFADRHRLMERA